MSEKDCCYDRRSQGPVRPRAVRACPCSRRRRSAFPPPLLLSLLPLPVLLLPQEEKTEFDVVLKACRRQQDRCHQGRPCPDRPGPEGSQGNGRRRSRRPSRKPFPRTMPRRSLPSSRKPALPQRSSKISPILQFTPQHRSAAAFAFPISLAEFAARRRRIK